LAFHAVSAADLDPRPPAARQHFAGQEQRPPVTDIIVAQDIEVGAEQAVFGSLRVFRRDPINRQERTRLEHEGGLIVPHSGGHHRVSALAIIGHAPAAHEEALLGKR